MKRGVTPGCGILRVGRIRGDIAAQSRCGDVRKCRNLERAASSVAISIPRRLKTSPPGYSVKSTSGPMDFRTLRFHSINPIGAPPPDPIARITLTHAIGKLETTSFSQLRFGVKWKVSWI